MTLKSTWCGLLFGLIFCMLLWYSDAAVAKSTNGFERGMLVKNPKTLGMSNAELYKITMGTPRRKAILKSGVDFEKYFAMRGPKSVAGKAFEARTTIRVNRFLKNTGSGNRLIVTAAEGLPNDAADLALWAPEGTILKRYQLKAGYEAAMSALSDPKYSGMTVVTHTDTFGNIRKELRNAKNIAQATGKPLVPRWKQIESAIREGRLTDNVDGYFVGTRKQAETVAKLHTKAMFEKGVTSLKTSVSAIPAERAVEKTGRKMLMRVGGRVMPIVVVGTGILDIGIGVHELNDSNRRFALGELDRDIYYGKQGIAATQLGLGTVTVVGGTVVLLNKAGFALLSAPEPVYTKIAGAVIIVASVGLVVGDYALERIHSNRIESRRKQLEQIDKRERQIVVINQLQNLAKNSTIPLI